jgi:hypothetical protein
MSRHVRPNRVMISLQDLIETLLYKDLNVTIHYQWASLFTSLMDLKSQIFNYSDASSNNFDSDNKEIHCTLTNLTIHNFLEILKIMNYCLKSMLSPFKFI